MNNKFTERLSAFYSNPNISHLDERLEVSGQLQDISEKRSKD